MHDAPLSTATAARAPRTDPHAPRIVVGPGPGWLRARSQRALTAHGIPAGWTCWVAAGAFPLQVVHPIASATGLPTVLHEGSSDEPAIAWLCPRASERFAARGGDLAALRQLIDDSALRAVRWSPTRVENDPRPRVLQVITSLQRGGAERLALHLHARYAEHGLTPLLAVTGRTERQSYPAPADAVFLGHPRAAEIAAYAQRSGADAVHAHLLCADELAACAAAGLPILSTVHNMDAAWPAGLGTHETLLSACSFAVCDALRRAGHRSVRVNENGVPAPIQPSAPAQLLVSAQPLPRPRATRLVLGALAHPRPQKRLEMLPAILAALHRRGVLAQLCLASEAGSSAVATQAQADLDAAIQAHGVAHAIDRVAPEEADRWWPRIDALLAPSRYEGLSLAQLEALAAGVPVFTSAAGHNHDAPGLHRLRVEDTAEDWAAAIATWHGMQRDQRALLPPALSLAACAQRAARLAIATIAATRGDGLWLLTNHLHVGGAQSSLRRLALALHAEGVRVRVAVFDESAAAPSAGLIALRAAGIPTVIADAGDDVEQTCRALALHVHDDPAAAVAAWNLAATRKLLLSQLLIGPRWYDVSPGEMNLSRLAERFAQPAPWLGDRSVGDYAARCAGIIVKHSGEIAAARAAFGREPTVIPNGVPLTRPARAGRGTAPLRLGTAARLAAHKRLDLLIAAFALALPHLPPCTLHIAGGADGDDHATPSGLRAAAAGLPIAFTGALDEAAMAAFLADLDLFVLIAEPEGCPNASLEAMAAGLAVLATDVGGMAEQVIPGSTGWLVPRHDDAALVAALIEATASRERLTAFGEAARERIAERFSIARMAADYRCAFGL